MRNGAAVARFEQAFAEFVGARFAIALCNGTATLHTALVALGVKPGDKVAVPPLTMSATTIAVLHAGAVPVFVDVAPDTWLMDVHFASDDDAWMPVDLYGLHSAVSGEGVVVDSAQTLRPNSGAAFTSYSFQASKLLPLGEGGMLVTDDEELAMRARSFSSLGYRMEAKQPRIDPATLKHPSFARHHTYPAWNYRMNDLTAERGLMILPIADMAIERRRLAADLYRRVVEGCDWLTPQHVPEGWVSDYWTYAVACDTPDRCLALLDAVERHGGERPYPAWRISYFEPAFREWGVVQALERGFPLCPVAESLQPRIIQCQTNDPASAERNSSALRMAIEELSA